MQVLVHLHGIAEAFAHLRVIEVRPLRRELRAHAEHGHERARERVLPARGARAHHHGQGNLHDAEAFLAKRAIAGHEFVEHGRMRVATGGNVRLAVALALAQGLLVVLDHAGTTPRLVDASRHWVR
jgi:hypothetical protein